jgi:hypothetical protein
LLNLARPPDVRYYCASYEPKLTLKAFIAEHQPSAPGPPPERPDDDHSDPLG